MKLIKPKKLLIVTGASRGLGLELCQRGLTDNFIVIGISRNNSIKHENYHHLKLDLSDSKKISEKLNQFIIKKNIKNITEVILINNAAMVTPIDFIEKIHLYQDVVIDHIQLNLTTPMILSSFLLNKYKLDKTKLSIINISSGAANYPINNWSLYCSTKAGLKMFTETLNNEYGKHKNFRTFNFYPGVMDTEMQSTIRKQKTKNFKDIERFKALKSEGRLLSAQWVAEVIFDIMNGPNSDNKISYDVGDYNEKK